mmetsp:Transcript_29268/g.90460  ORF Transcript_29268/g.90460 Transcript_29268/m.90460 type:complete len:301 (-) Transcript_29268:24-926(-)
MVRWCLRSRIAGGCLVGADARRRGKVGHRGGVTDAPVRSRAAVGSKAGAAGRLANRRVSAAAGRAGSDDETLDHRQAVGVGRRRHDVQVPVGHVDAKGVGAGHVDEHLLHRVVDRVEDHEQQSPRSVPRRDGHARAPLLDARVEVGAVAEGGDGAAVVRGLHAEDVVAVRHEVRLEGGRPRHDVHDVPRRLERRVGRLPAHVASQQPDAAPRVGWDKRDVAGPADAQVEHLARDGAVLVAADVVEEEVGVVAVQVQLVDGGDEVEEGHQPRHVRRAVVGDAHNLEPLQAREGALGAAHRG